MINSLYLKHFVKHKNLNIDFAEGVNHICGANEAGKSLLIEAISFALFGSSALRLPANTYSRETHVCLVFKVQDKQYTLNRSLSTAYLQTECSIIASGNKPVTETVTRLLGFNQLVFNVANLCKQFDVTRMSSLTPAERRKIIDNVVGLSGIEKVIKQHKAELTSLNSVAKTLSALRPAKVSEPDKEVNTDLIEGYTVQMQSYNRILVELESNRSQFNRLKQQLDAVRIAPKIELPYDFNPDVAEEYRRQVGNLVSQIKAMGSPEKPNIAFEDLQEAWNLYELQKQKNKLESMGGHTCESCGHFTALGGSQLAELKEKLGGLHHQQPTTTLAQWTQANESLVKLAKLRENLSNLLSQNGQPHTVEQIQAQRQALSSHNAHQKTVDARDILAKQLSDLNYDSEKVEQEILHVKQDQAHLNSQYQHELDLKHQWAAFTKYQTELENWTARYTENESQMEAFKLEILVLTELMAKIKSELLPNVNQVASSLLSLMSDGMHTQLELTEDMEILVGGVTVDALSGSGKSIAHLSLRLSLAQILTTGVFPVFIADEVDASMTDTRSRLTLEALRLMLTKTVKQLIIISHKTLDDVDHVIQL